MPATIHVRLPVDASEHAELLKRAGEIGVAAYIRKLLGLAPRRPGRPPGKKPAK